MQSASGHVVPGAGKCGKVHCCLFFTASSPYPFSLHTGLLCLSPLEKVLLVFLCWLWPDPDSLCHQLPTTLHPTWNPIETRIQGLGCHFMLMGITSSQILGFDSAWSVMGWVPGRLSHCWIAIKAQAIHIPQTMHPSWSQNMREITHSCYEQWPTKQKPLVRIPSSLKDLCRHFVLLT